MVVYSITLSTVQISACLLATTMHASTQIIIQRRKEVLSVECELSEVHSLLARIPPDLDWEEAVERALQLFAAHPPNKVATKRRLSFRRR